MAGYRACAALATLVLWSSASALAHSAPLRVAPDVSSVHITSQGKTLFGRLFSPALESAESKAPSVFMLHGIPGTDEPDALELAPVPTDLPAIAAELGLSGAHLGRCDGLWTAAGQPPASSTVRCRPQRPSPSSASLASTRRPPGRSGRSGGSPTPSPRWASSTGASSSGPASSWRSPRPACR